ncbi:hypothetical protein [Vibrio tetraodonis]|nr:hypothetical protein [Vibrio tetraodonis]
MANLNRRIIFDNETQINKKQFSQTIDIDLDLEGTVQHPLHNLPGYFIRSVESALKYTEFLISKGITNITYRLGGGLQIEEPDSYVYAPLLLNSESNVCAKFDADTILDKHVEFYTLLRKVFPRGYLHITADPFGIAPNLSDGAWGARDERGELDEEQTYLLLEKIADKYSSCDVDALLTMGRVENEVEITRRVIDSNKRNTEIYAFSQNIESKAAYVYLDKLNKADSYQKILPGNITEMKIRTILDIYAGVDAIIVKPSENLHVIQFTKDYVTSPEVALSFLESIVDSDIFGDKNHIRSICKKILEDKNTFENNCKRVTIGTYAVSGSYLMDKLLEENKGKEFSFNVQNEKYRNIISIIGDRMAHIIDRSTESYLDFIENGDVSE